jgi:hypothetical protein
MPRLFKNQIFSAFEVCVIFLREDEDWKLWKIGINKINLALPQVSLIIASRHRKKLKAHKLLC